MTTRRKWVTVVMALISVLAVTLYLFSRIFSIFSYCETELALANKIIAAYQSGQCRSGLKCRIVEVGVNEKGAE